MSPEHGYNFCIPTCFWCMGSHNILFMAGATAPVNLSKLKDGIHLNYDLCYRCDEKRVKAGGVFLFEVSAKPIEQGQEPMKAEADGHRAYPTRRKLFTTEQVFTAITGIETEHEALAKLTSCEGGGLDTEAFTRFNKDLSDLKDILRKMDKACQPEGG